MYLTTTYVTELLMQNTLFFFIQNKEYRRNPPLSYKKTIIALVKIAFTALEELETQKIQDSTYFAIIEKKLEIIYSLPFLDKNDPLNTTDYKNLLNKKNILQKGLFLENGQFFIYLPQKTTDSQISKNPPSIPLRLFLKTTNFQEKTNTPYYQIINEKEVDILLSNNEIKNPQVTYISCLKDLNLDLLRWSIKKKNEDILNFLFVKNIIPFRLKNKNIFFKSDINSNFSFRMTSLIQNFITKYSLLFIPIDTHKNYQEKAVSLLGTQKIRSSPEIRLLSDEDYFLMQCVDRFVPEKLKEWQQNDLLSIEALFENLYLKLENLIKNYKNKGYKWGTEETILTNTLTSLAHEICIISKKRELETNLMDLITISFFEKAIYFFTQTGNRNFLDIAFHYFQIHTRSYENFACEFLLSYIQSHLEQNQERVIILLEEINTLTPSQAEICIDFFLSFPRPHLKTLEKIKQISTFLSTRKNIYKKINGYLFSCKKKSISPDYKILIFLLSLTKDFSFSKNIDTLENFLCYLSLEKEEDKKCLLLLMQDKESIDFLKKWTIEKKSQAGIEILYLIDVPSAKEAEKNF